MLRFSNFSKSYNGHRVLNIDDLSVEPGIYWLKGANGTGKTTLLKSIAGILHFEGNIVFRDSITLKKHPREFRSHVNFAEAEPVYPRFLTGAEMIDLYKTAKKGTTAQCDFFIESMGMTSYIDDQLGTYSTGMLKKLSLVLALMGNCEVVLLDEPLITLDTGSVDILYRWIADRHTKQSTTFLLSSHQPLEIRGDSPIKQLVVKDQTLTRLV